jgi:hypothetical protein
VTAVALIAAPGTKPIDQPLMMMSMRTDSTPEPFRASRSDGPGITNRP